MKGPRWGSQVVTLSERFQKLEFFGGTFVIHSPKKIVVAGKGSRFRSSFHSRIADRAARGAGRGGFALRGEGAL